MSKNIELAVIRPAVGSDLEEIKVLLDKCSLPFVDIDDHINNFLVLEYEGKIIGAIGMELYGNKALLRSLVVDNEYQKQGLGLELYLAFISEAKKKRVEEIYLLTETADGFFSKQGINRISRETVPVVIASTNEFTSLCPSTATCMLKKITKNTSILYGSA